ncbi:MAG TPA: pyridoxamine 5'-phosphate oxidase family protein [Pseudonocardiaceae bacterium]|nr:pyridoxamine 5'-phosphate oxidase family protein [Pseudonocardiaceae bacterium]
MDLDHARGIISVSTQQTAFKVRNLRRDSRAWLCVLSDGFYGRWIQVSGSVRIVERPEAMEPLVDLYRSISGEHSDWNDYRTAMEREQRVLLQIELISAGPDREG